MASKRTRVKSAALPIEAPSNAEQAAVMVARIGELIRDLAVNDVALDEQVAAIKLSFGQADQPLISEMKKLHAAVQAWAQANRAELTQDGRTKTIRLASGKLEWRTRPPRVRITDEEAVLTFLANASLTEFIRTKQEISREAILANPAGVAAVPGISVGSAGEEFIVVPAGAEAAA